MSADEEPVDWTRVTGRLLLERVPEEQRREVKGWLDLYQNDVRAAVLREAVALVELHVDLGAPPQRILTELRRMADNPKES